MVKTTLFLSENFEENFKALSLLNLGKKKVHHFETCTPWLPSDLVISCWSSFLPILSSSSPPVIVSTSIVASCKSANVLFQMLSNSCWFLLLGNYSLLSSQYQKPSCKITGGNHSHVPRNPADLIHQPILDPWSTSRQLCQFMSILNVATWKEKHPEHLHSASLWPVCLIC